MSKYIDIQNQLIIDYKIIHDPNSTCWRRTHVHTKERRICKHFIKESYNSLFTLLHEIGHCEANTYDMRRVERESSATLWAVSKMKELGFSIRRKVTKSYKDYIQMTLDRGIRRGGQGYSKSKLYL